MDHAGLRRTDVDNGLRGHCSEAALRATFGETLTRPLAEIVVVVDALMMVLFAWYLVAARVAKRRVATPAVPA